ncbi:MAG TPA: heparinase II/III-family protein, partial [Candidatus Sulfotelmatobacter sp.]|nr:heparinase II/III-family protein [Candidatus Sulfotelmatobacter sp.]
FGDDDGGRLFDSSRNRTEHMTDPLAVGTSIYGEEALRNKANITEEAIWLLGSAGIEFLRRNPAGSAPPTSYVFPDGGIYVIAGSGPVPPQMIIDAGPQGTGHSGHGHADALSVKLSFAGRRWLVDSGTFCYISPDDERNRFRGTRAHNTLAVDGLDQAQPQGPFAWDFIPTTKVEHYTSAPTFTFFAASHSGYERLPHAVRHRRFVFQYDRNSYLIRDVAQGQGMHLLETSWHFAPDLNVCRSGNGFLAGLETERLPNSEQPCLKLLPVEDSRWTGRLVSEYVSPAYGEKASAAVLRCAAGVPLPAETTMLLIPTVASQISANHDSRFFREECENPHAPDAVYRCDQGQIKHLFVFGKGGTEWTFGNCSSTARFLYLRLNAQRADRLFFCDASVLEFQGRSVIHHARPLEWLQWQEDDGRELVTCSDSSASGSFDASILRQATVFS